VFCLFAAAVSTYAFAKQPALNIIFWKYIQPCMAVGAEKSREKAAVLFIFLIDANQNQYYTGKAQVFFLAQAGYNLLTGP